MINLARDFLVIQYGKLYVWFVPILNMLWFVYRICYGMYGSYIEYMLWFVRTICYGSYIRYGVGLLRRCSPVRVPCVEWVLRSDK